MSHLGDRVAAFVDGQLSPEAAERATAHLLFCRPCRDLVDLERLTKARLAALTGPAPTPDLVGRLLAMGGPAGPLRPRPGHVPGTPRPATVPVRSPLSGAVQRRGGTGPWGPSPARPSGRSPVLARRRGRLAVAVAGALSVVGVGVAGVAVGSGTVAGGARPATPQMDTLLDSSARSASTGLAPGFVTPVRWLRAPAASPSAGGLAVGR